MEPQSLRMHSTVMHPENGLIPTQNERTRNKCIPKYPPLPTCSIPQVPWLWEQSTMEETVEEWRKEVDVLTYVVPPLVSQAS